MREPLAKLGGGENRVGVGVSPGRWPLPQDPSPPGHFPPPPPASNGCQALERRQTPGCETRGHSPKGSSMGTALQGLAGGQRTPV